MSLYYDDLYIRYFGIEKIIELFKRKFYWSNIDTDVQDYIKTCPICQGKAVNTYKPYRKLNPLPVPLRPWKHISMDWITGLPASETRNGQVFDAILIMVDRFSRIALFLACQTTMDAAEFAETIYREVDMRFGPPSNIVSDRDSRITNGFWKEVYQHAKIKRRLSTAFHPQTDGLTKALNKVVENYLRAYTNLEQRDWATLLYTAAFAYNNTFNHTLKMTPFKCVYGYDPKLHIDIGDDVPKEEISLAKERVQKLKELRQEFQ
jgi:hypothetical protein